MDIALRRRNGGIIEFLGVVGKNGKVRKPKLRRVNPQQGRYQVTVHSPMIPTRWFSTLSAAKKWISGLNSRGVLAGRRVDIYDTETGTFLMEKQY